MAYCGGNSLSGVIVQYNTEIGEWSELPSPPMSGFAMTSFNDQSVLAGGSDDDTRITVQDSAWS